ncbi:carbon starvation protein A [bacterium]|nr:carbon starvation protein A [bacterium]
MTWKQKSIWVLVALLGAGAFSTIAIHRGETINSIWFILAAICTYLVAYRFYSAWICAKVLALDPTRATPAERLNDGRDFVPTNKWIVFGHHFAAISGPGPLIGPTLAAQFGYLPGTIWILVGAVLGGCVQDMVVMFLSVRRDGKSLGQMAREELGAIGGFAALIGTFMIIIILIAVLGLVIVKATKFSPWATSTVFFTIPIAMFIGLYLRFIRVGKVGEASVIGFSLLLLAVFGGEWIKASPMLTSWFTLGAMPIAIAVMVYGFTAAVLPVWLLLAPRDYLSTFLKIGTISFLAFAILIIHPDIQMPAFTQFVDGSGPVFGGAIFPFVFITIACGAISGFHALVSSGTTSKIIASEAHIRMVGYGSMAMESFVAIMAMIAATILQPGVYFAINSPGGVVGEDIATAVQTITSWGFPVTAEHMNELAATMGEDSLMARTGGAPSLAVGMAYILAGVFGKHLLALWYHFAIMFEAVFILTALDAGTRVARFMLQDLLGAFYAPLGRTSWYPSVLATSFLVVLAWGYFLYVGVIDPYGGVNILWPLFGMSNQMLAGMALCLCTALIVKSGKQRFALITALPLAWILLITSVATYDRLFSDDIRIGYIAAANDWMLKIKAGGMDADKLAIAEKMFFNNNLVAGLSAFFLLLFWIVVLDMLRLCYRRLVKGEAMALREAAYQKTLLEA